MAGVDRPGHGLSRRALLPGLVAIGLPGGAAPRDLFPSEAKAYLDPATELPVARLTDPSFSSGFPPSMSGALARRGGFLLYWSERTGSPQVFRMNLKTGESEQLTGAEALDRGSVSLQPDERGFCHFDGAWLYQTNLATLRPRRLYASPAGWAPGGGFSLSADGRRAAFIERRGASYRLRLLAISTGSVATVVETDAPLANPLFRPQGTSILYERVDRGLWLGSFDGREQRRLKLAPGGAGSACWTPDGGSVLYLSFPEDKRALNSIRECRPEQNLDVRVAPTSQFVSFSANRDGSVFVGASANRASPYILLLIRATGKELTLCEHRASAPAAVSAMFSPDSQQVYFSSDRHGRNAIYQMRVDRLVEKTDT